MGLVDESTSTGQHAPEPQIADLPPEPAAAAASEPDPEPPAVEQGDTVTLAVTGPQWVTSFTSSADETATLVVTSEGVQVPSGSVDALIAEAARSGVHLSRK